MSILSLRMILLYVWTSWQIFMKICMDVMPLNGTAPSTVLDNLDHTSLYEIFCGIKVTSTVATVLCVWQLVGVQIHHLILLTVKWGIFLFILAIFIVKMVTNRENSYWMKLGGTWSTDYPEAFHGFPQSFKAMPVIVTMATPYPSLFIVGRNKRLVSTVIASSILWKENLMQLITHRAMSSLQT